MIGIQCVSPVGASRLDTDASLTPVPTLGVVSVHPSVLCSYLIRSVPLSVVCGLMPWLFLLLRWFVPDGVTGPETDPLWDRTVLLLGLGQLLLGAERLVGLWN